MDVIIPDFYGNFVCKADQCRHTCCAGWEIDVDVPTLARYEQTSGALGVELRNNLVHDDDVWHFRLRENGRCPFLRDNGLCYLIGEKGENFLTEICRRHPRFYTKVNGMTLAGVGLSCEKTVELLLASDKSLQFVSRKRKTPAPSVEEVMSSASAVIAAVASVNAPMTLAELTSKLRIPFSARELSFVPDADAEAASFAFDCHAALRPIDAEWEDYLAHLQDRLTNLPPDWTEALPEGLFRRIYDYILYRALERVDTDGAESVAAYAQIGTEFIAAAARITGDLPDAVRRWSAEVEYCPENVDLLLTLA